MIETIVKNRSIKPTYPKLMQGLQTGTIYLVTEGNHTPLDFEYKTIVLSHSKDSDQKIGDVNRYSSSLLVDFEGEVTLRGII